MSLDGRELVVEFGGVRALAGVTVEVQPGVVLGVVGPNGAGKTTLFNCLTGFVRPASGSVLIDERDILGLAPYERARLGIARAFQTPRLDLESDVLSAVLLGGWAVHRPSTLEIVLGTPSARRSERAVRERGEAALEAVGLAAYRNREVEELSLAHLRLLEVARAIASEPRYLLLDEPAAGLGIGDRERLSSVIRQLASSGLGILLIEHNVDFVADISDKVQVLSRGQTIFNGPPGEFRSSAIVQEAYVGGPITRKDGDR